MRNSPPASPTTRPDTRLQLDHPATLAPRLAPVLRTLTLATLTAASAVACHPDGSQGSAESSSLDARAQDMGGSIDGGTLQDAQNGPETGVNDAGEQGDVFTGQDASGGDSAAVDATLVRDAATDAGCTPSEELCNGEDDNCNGEIDESFPENGEECLVPCALGACTAGARECVDGELKCVSTVQAAFEEVCNNGIDDNCDGLVDKAPNCFANCAVGSQIPQTPGPLYGNGSPVCAPNPRGDQAVEECAPDQTWGFTCPNGFAVCE